MEIAEYINHPERLDRDTLYELRSMLALYPYFQSARLLLLQNLFLLHDPSFDEELRRAAIYSPTADQRRTRQSHPVAHRRLPRLHPQRRASSRRHQRPQAHTCRCCYRLRGLPPRKRDRRRSRTGCRGTTAHRTRTHRFVHRT